MNCRGCKGCHVYLGQRPLLPVLVRVACETNGNTQKELHTHLGQEARVWKASGQAGVAQRRHHKPATQLGTYAVGGIRSVKGLGPRSRQPDGLAQRPRRLGLPVGWWVWLLHLHLELSQSVLGASSGNTVGEAWGSLPGVLHKKRNILKTRQLVAWCALHQ